MKLIKVLKNTILILLFLFLFNCELIISKDQSLQNWIQTDQIEVSEVKNEIQKPPGVVKESDCDIPPVPLRFSPPVYPEKLERAGIEGVVNFAVVIDSIGFVSNFSVAYATDSLFAGSVEEASKKWKFKPAVIDDKPVKCFKEHYFNFRLGR